MAAGENTFDGGPGDGTAISVANSGETSGDAAFAVTIGLNCLLEYDSGQARGTFSARYLMDATAAATHIRFREDIGSGDCWYAIDYRKASHPASNFFYLLRINESGTSARAGGIAIRNDGTIRFDDSAGTSVAALSGTSVIPNDQWVRVELRLNVTSGEAEWWYYADASSDTATETLSTTGVSLGSNSLHEVQTGAISTVSNVNGREWWIDNVRWSNEGKIGPWESFSGRRYQRLYGPAQLGTVATDLYTVPDDARVRLRHIYANNPSGSPVTLTIRVDA
jgi:hypothetical protein